MTIGKTLLEVSAFVALMLIVGRRALPWLLWQVARTGSRELFTLCGGGSAIGIAYGSAQLFSVSFALGAFFAGMVMRESEFSHPLPPKNPCRCAMPSRCSVLRLGRHAVRPGCSA
jgi:CPA2 family monovalent cation:H+ antiporter-2